MKTSKGKGKVRVSTSFHRAAHMLKGMKTKQREKALANSSNIFVRDLSRVLGKVRHISPDALHVNPRLMRRLQFQRKALRSFSNAKVSMKKKRRIVQTQPPKCRQG